MTAYYNEIDPYAAQWLRNLIDAGHIAPGIVDERSIEDVRPSDLAGYRQCHFFAGVGVWSLALRRAGWPDDRPVWTGSCPCQPFSAAGKGAAFSDERHLWPAFFHLIEQCRPPVIFGEQVAGKDANPWIDLVQDDMEGVGYGLGAVPFPSAGIGAPHIRDRLYWVADAERGGDRSQAATAGHREPQANRSANRARRRGVLARRMADAHGWHAGAERQQRSGQQRQQPQDGGAVWVGHSDVQRCEGLGLHVRPGRPHEDPTQVTGRGEAGGLADAAGQGRGPERADCDAAHSAEAIRARQEEPGRCSAVDRPGPVNGFWRAADWLGCTDGRWRPVEPGTFPLVDGPAARVGRVRSDWQAPAGPQAQGHRNCGLKGYGNAINAIQAQTFIEVFLEAA